MEKTMSTAFGKKVYLLGKDKGGIYYWLEEASWDCDWYWGYGYVETYTNNKYPNLARDISSHQHFDGLFLRGPKMCKDMFDDFFEETPLNDNEKWELLELMNTFYKIKEYSNILHLGGNNITKNPIERTIKNEEEYSRINKVVLPQLFEEVYKLLEK